MAMQVKVDGSGRMVIPIRLRRSLGLADGGGTIEVVEGPDGLTLHPAEGERVEPVVDDHGLLVLDPGRPADVQEVAEAIAADRDRRG